jgi:serine O-acetyltransferase
LLFAVPGLEIPMNHQTEAHDRKARKILVKVLKGIATSLSSVRLIPLITVMLLSSNRNTIYIDLDRWAYVHRFGQPRRLTERVLVFVQLMTWTPEYRNVFYLRTGVLGKLFYIFCRPLSSLDLGNTSFGPGLFIMHGNGTYVSAAEIGKNCTIYQQVTIGYNQAFELSRIFPKLETDTPRIGNDVTIYAGAKILGRVSIGDNVTIAANTVVIKDVPSDSTVMGVPGKVVWNKKLSPKKLSPHHGEVDHGAESNYRERASLFPDPL